MSGYSWGTGTATAGTLTAIWGLWLSSESTTAASTLPIVGTWGCDPDNSSTTNGSWVAWNSNYSVKWETEPTSPQQRASLEEEAKRRKCRRAAAAKKAYRLLRQHLNPEQRGELNGTGVFTVISSTGRRFQVDITKRMHNVFELDESGRRVTEHCIYAGMEVPLADNALAQKLLLETDESRFREIANQRALAA